MRRKHYSEVSQEPPEDEDDPPVWMLRLSDISAGLALIISLATVVYLFIVR